MLHSVFAKLTQPVFFPEQKNDQKTQNKTKASLDLPVLHGHAANHRQCLTDDAAAKRSLHSMQFDARIPNENITMFWVPAGIIAGCWLYDKEKVDDWLITSILSPFCGDD